uniref:Uncharacterized protein n=1 Tax=uncultured marine bacterium MedDCM-OCT-S08-C1622 TaxID=743073 RepID=D6PDW8_9BACT|nr:hypothetical protein [uncultured marine bacterium MedDCM-OCT-S08-C1622]
MSATIVPVLISTTQKLHTLQALAHKVKPINEAMWARAEEVTGVEGIAEEYYGYYNDSADLVLAHTIVGMPFMRVFNRGVRKESRLHL